MHDGLLYGSHGTLVSMMVGVCCGDADSGVMGILLLVLLYGVMVGVFVGEAIGRTLLLLLRFCSDFLFEGTFFCVERFLGVGVIVRATNL